ncbi:hypothetical protein ZHAS_00009404 [Anopheles sinensis]|uniref:Uncharacterized protein n=1 Tax=Anopheles sinensis TaxID=74873 RepID=A0A084VUV3_ANOSI|nr:hypothetical protein ZHAS_00009404 [Anopheles sinensis]
MKGAKEPRVKENAVNELLVRFGGKCFPSPQTGGEAANGMVVCAEVVLKGEKTVSLQGTECREDIPFASL